MQNAGKISKCNNCAHQLHHDDRFCSSCGQDTHTHKLPFKHFVVEFLEGTLHLDTKIIPTLKKLLISPGIIINDYNHNKRARYVPPIRLYIFVSFVCFYLLNDSFEHSIDRLKIELASGVKNYSINTFQISLITKTRIDRSVFLSLLKLDNLTDARIDSVLKANKVESDVLNRRVLYQIMQFKKGGLTSRELEHRFISTFSKMMFILMPLFALIILLVNGWRNLFYSEALVFSLYYHSFIFIIISLVFEFSSFINLWFLSSTGAIVALIYLLSSIKIGFDKPWGRATVNTFLCTLIYLLFFDFFLILAFITSVIM